MRAVGLTTLTALLALCVARPAASPLAQGMPASGGLTIPMPPPEPPPRPDALIPPAAADPPLAAAPASPVVAAPKPPERPAELTPAATPPTPAAASEPPPLPPQRPPELSGEAALALTVATSDDSACRKRLERLGATFEPMPALSNGQCGAGRPLKLSQLAGGIALAPPAILVCGAAEALARWATEAEAAAERELGQPLTSLSLGGSYECRGQNHDADAKLSEHSFANAVDVMGYGFARRAPILVGSPAQGPAAQGPAREGPAREGSAEAAFLAAARAKACGVFRTVLGPGSDAAHSNHLHLDERERPSGHRLCQ